MPTEQTIMNANDLKIIDGAEELTKHTDLNIEQATALVDLINFRAGNRSDGHKDLILVMEEWMADFWARDYDQPVDTGILLAAEVEDYSAKAWKLDGGYIVKPEGLDVDTTVTQSVEVLKHGTDEYPRDDGETWLAKSGTVSIFSLAE